MQIIFTIYVNLREPTAKLLVHIFLSNVAYQNERTIILNIAHNMMFNIHIFNFLSDQIFELFVILLIVFYLLF